MTALPPILTIVIPCYNEEQVLPETARRLDILLTRFVGIGLISASSSVCFVDDGSKDRTWEIVRELHGASARFGGIRLSRNRGHQNALVSGLLAAPGDLIVSIDADLQDDLDAIERMVIQAVDGTDIVYGVRGSRQTDTVIKRVTAQAYYRLLEWLSVEIVFNHADFRLMSRRAVEALREYGETNLFLRALVPQLGFKTSIVVYERAARFAGTSKYPLGKMLTLAFDGISSFSTKPLRLVTLTGAAVFVVALILTIWALIESMVFDATIPGWASTVIPIYLISGVQLLCVGVIGEYVGKIYLETKRRPRSHLAEVLRATCVIPNGPEDERIGVSDDHHQNVGDLRRFPMT